MSLAIYFFPKPLKTTGEFPVMLRFTFEGDKRYNQLFTVNKKDWDPKNKQVRRSHPLYAELNDILETELIEAKRRHLELVKAKLPNNFDYVLGKKSFEEVTKGELDEFLFENITKRFYSHKRGENIEESSLIQYENLIKDLNACIGSMDIRYMTKDTAAKLIDYFKGKKRKNGNTTIINKFTLLNHIIDWASDDLDIPLKKIRSKLKRNEKPKDKFTSEDIDKWEEVEGLTSAQSEARAIFLFQFNLLGGRISDALLMKKETMRSERVDYTTKKRKVNKSVKIHESLQKIIDERIDTPGIYLFSYMEDFMKNWDGNKRDLELELRRKAISINGRLKKVAEIAGINKNVSTSVARHSFAKQAEDSGLSLRHIQKALGHSKLAITEIYLGKLKDDEIDESVDTFYNKK